MSAALLGLMGSLPFRCGSSISLLSHNISRCCSTSSPLTQSSGSPLLSAFLRSSGVASTTGSSQPASGLHYSTGTSEQVGLSNLRDNPGATRQRIRLGRGDSARRGNFSGRGMKGQKARAGNKPHMLFDGGQLGLLKYPISREQPSFEVLYKQVGLPRLIEYVQLGLLDAKKVITMKDLYDTGCIQGNVRYGVQLYGKAFRGLRVPLHIQVTACTDDARAAIEVAGGTVERVYYTADGILGLIHPTVFTHKKLPLPPPAHSWHPRYEGLFDAIGQLPPSKQLPGAPQLLGPGGAAAVVEGLLAQPSADASTH